MRVDIVWIRNDGWEVGNEVNGVGDEIVRGDVMGIGMEGVDLEERRGEDVDDVGGLEVDDMGDGRMMKGDIMVEKLVERMESVVMREVGGEEEER